MTSNNRRTLVARLLLVVGGLAVLATGADHLEEYALNQFSTVPTIGTLFLLNFIAATALGAGLVLSAAPGVRGSRDVLRSLLALGGIGLAGSSLVALWISEHSSLFGFSDHGDRPAIVAAIVAETVAVLALSAYLALAHRPHLGSAARAARAQ